MTPVPSRDHTNNKLLLGKIYVLLLVNNVQADFDFKS